MFGKHILVIIALAFVNPIRAAESNHDGHGHSDSGKAAAEKTPIAEKAGGSQDIKSPAKAKTCKPHNASKADCFICDASLRDKGRLWCKEHARYEDRCFLCHPEIKDAKRLYCKEHSLYEDECFLCHPELKKSKQPGTPAKSGKGEAAPAHGSHQKKG